MLQETLYGVVEHKRHRVQWYEIPLKLHNPRSSRKKTTKLTNWYKRRSTTRIKHDRLKNGKKLTECYMLVNCCNWKISYGVRCAMIKCTVDAMHFSVIFSYFIWEQKTFQVNHQFYIKHTWFSLEAKTHKYHDFAGNGNEIDSYRMNPTCRPMVFSFGHMPRVCLF